MKQLTTVSELENWQAFFCMHREQHEKADWYAASICTTIIRAMTGKVEKIEDHLLKFHDPAKKTAKLTDPTGSRSKAAWGAALGMTLE